jgi:hypothetical protein
VDGDAPPPSDFPGSVLRHQTLGMRHRGALVRCSRGRVVGRSYESPPFDLEHASDIVLHCLTIPSGSNASGFAAGAFSALPASLTLAVPSRLVQRPQATAIPSFMRVKNRAFGFPPLQVRFGSGPPEVHPSTISMQANMRLRPDLRLGVSDASVRHIAVLCVPRFYLPQLPIVPHQMPRLSSHITTHSLPLAHPLLFLALPVSFRLRRLLTPVSITDNNDRQGGPKGNSDEQASDDAPGW